MRQHRREGHDGDRRHRRRRSERVGQRGVPIVLKNPHRVQQRQHDHGPHVGHAREEEERDCPAGDVLGVHPAAVQRPRAEGQTAGAADRQHGVRGLLGHSDLIAQPPRHPRAENRPEDHNVGQRR